MSTDRALTIRVPEDMRRRLAIHRALTGESTNTLALRLFQGYLDTEGRRAVTSAAFDRVDEQYRVVLDKLA